MEHKKSKKDININLNNCGLYYKSITIVNDASCVTIQIVATLQEGNWQLWAKLLEANFIIVTRL